MLAALERRGASFFADLTRATGRLASEVEDALWELVAAGLVTADGFENLRALLDPKRRRGEGRGRTRAPAPRAPAAGRCCGRARPAPDGAMPKPSPASCSLRWGVRVPRCWSRARPLAPPWRDLLVALRRMEARGEIRGGRFVGRLHRRAVRAARGARSAARRCAARAIGREELEVSAADPLNLAGILLPGPRLSATSGETLRLAAGPAAPQVR